MYRSFVTMILLAALSAPAAAGQAADPFGVIIDAARRSEEARKTATPAEPNRPIIALPKALRLPRPEPGPPRTAMHAHVGPDGRVSYECSAAHSTVEGVRP